MRRPLVCLSYAVTIIGLATAANRAQEWTRFRGPNGTGLSGERSLPAKWTAADYRWQASLPGQGHSSPVLWGDRLFLLSADPATATRYVLCFSATDGRLLWRREYPSETHKLSPRNTYATSTPTVDAERVYVAWSSPAQITLLALDHDGREVWQQNLGKWVSQHGFGVSPVLCAGLVVLSNSQDTQELEPGQAPGDSSISAFDAKTGAHRWTTPRVASRACYSVPCIYQPEGGKPELLFITTSEGVFGLDPATGAEKWRVPKVFSMRVVSSPLLVGDLVFGSNGSGGGGNYLTAVRLGAKRAPAYTVKNGPYVPCAVAKDDMVFLFADKGIVSCVDLQTGQAHWQERLGRGFSGSPVMGGDKVYCINDDGIVYVVAAAKQFQLLSENPLGEPSRSTPAIANGRLYLRTLSRLFCVGAARE
jgi:outer membrane protein assembly factor BamB